MLSLNKIRGSFAPYIPIRWKVQFSDTKLNVVSDMFPAKEVTYNEVEYENKTVELGIGINVSFNVLTKPITGITVSFYENEKKDIVNYIRKLNKNLDTGRGGFTDGLDFKIIEYDKKLKEMSRSTYIVQISDSITTILQQSASPWNGNLKLLVVGKK